MSGNVPYCKNLSGVKIITGYDSLGTHTGTITFTTDIPFIEDPFVFITVVNAGDYCFAINLTSRLVGSFSYAKWYNGTGSAANEQFYWMAIGKTSNNGNVPYCPGLLGQVILTGTDVTNTHEGSVSFSTNFIHNPFVFMNLISSNNNNVTINLTTQTTTSGFSYSKWFNGNNSAAGEDFAWMAIGTKSDNGNVPYCPGLSGVIILTGINTVIASSGTVTFEPSNSFTNIPTVIMSIDQGGYSVGYVVSISSINHLSFNYIKKYDKNYNASGEKFQWMAIGN